MLDLKKQVKIETIFFQNRGEALYCILDGASVADLLFKLDESEPEYACLYRGNLPHDIEEVAPYLVKLEKDSALLKWVVTEGWGNHWGIFALIPERKSFSKVKKHFRSIVKVKDPDGKHLFFRYYDPRVLSMFLPTCEGEQLDQMFGPVTTFFSENDAADALLSFSCREDKLEISKVVLK